jgi:DNA recombination protein RmuC
LTFSSQNHIVSAGNIAGGFNWRRKMQQFVALIGLSTLVVVLIAMWNVRQARRSADVVRTGLQQVHQDAERTDRAVRDETGRVRSELLASLGGQLEQRLASLDTAQEARFSAIRGELDRQRSALAESLDRHAESTASRVGVAVDRNDASFGTFGQQLGQFEANLDGRFEALRGSVDSRLAQIQEDSAAKLTEMRATVEEKLQSTLERRVGESFALVSQQLEQVHRALGEMQTLSAHVGDLRRVMSNVRARGALGEWRLEALLQELLAPDQFARNVRPVVGSGATVEFAIRMPRSGDTSATTWLPVDSKFPLEDYERVVSAQDAGDREALDAARLGLAAAVRKAAKDIHEKYVSPPTTTEYAILFLPTESLFAEVVRLPALTEDLQRDYRVMVAGPTTFATLLNALQMGFRTVALTDRANEVWSLLGAVRTEFGKFTDAMTLVKKKLAQATTAVESIEVRRRAMDRKLRLVDTLPPSAPDNLLQLPVGTDRTVDADAEIDPADPADSAETMEDYGRSRTAGS